MPDWKEGYAFYRVSAARKPLPLGATATTAASSLALSGASRQLSQRESLLPSYYASPSPDGLGGIDLRPAGAEGGGGGFGFGFGAEHAEDRRAAAGH